MSKKLFDAFDKLSAALTEVIPPMEKEGKGGAVNEALIDLFIAIPNLGIKFPVESQVKKVTGDYTFEGEVVAAFQKLNGMERYVVQDDRGALHIYGPKNLSLKGE